MAEFPFDHRTVAELDALPEGGAEVSNVLPFPAGGRGAVLDLYVEMHAGRAALLGAEDAQTTSLFCSVAMAPELRAAITAHCGCFHPIEEEGPHAA